MTSDCIGDTVFVTPYNGMVSRQSAAEPTNYYAAWKNTESCGPKAAIEKAELTEGQKEIADVNNDGAVDVFDATDIKNSRQKK